MDVDKKKFADIENIKNILFCTGIFWVGQMHYGPPNEIMAHPKYRVAPPMRTMIILPPLVSWLYLVTLRLYSSMSFLGMKSFRGFFSIEMFIVLVVVYLLIRELLKLPFLSLKSVSVDCNTCTTIVTHTNLLSAVSLRKLTFFGAR
jgi:hypothetical protein